ncbi:MAG: Flagellar M-ring protein [Petrotoga mobilis]|nr:MAG: Flagellar M-ring protein [Petrotoga mobilis]
MEKYLQQIRDWWKNLEERKKRNYIVLFFSVIVLIIFFSILLSRKSYEFFIGGLDQANAGNIVTKFEEMGIEYKVDDYGNIFVANQNVSELRMRLASEGSLGYKLQGYELLQNQGFGATSYDKQVNYQIALEGELSRSIASIQSVQSARVHLVIPPRTYYQVGESPKPSASVLLVLRPGMSITSNQIKGIINLVAGAVAGLHPENVKVVDNFSNDLSAQVAVGEDISSADTKFKLKTEIEKYYKQKVESGLQSVFGLGNVVVVPEIELKWQKIEEEQRKVEPVVDENGIILSQQTRSEQSSSSPSGGVPGVDSNIPPYTYQTPTSTGNYYSSSDVITNYDVNEIYQRTIEDKSGEISNKSVTLFIDFQNSKVDDNQELRSQITKAVSTAVGAPENNISLVDIRFNRDLEAMRANIEYQLQQRRQRIANIVIAIIVIAFIMMLIILVARARRVRKASKLVEERKRQLESRVEEAMKERGVEVEEVSPEQERLREIATWAENNPDEVADIIKSWLKTR